MFFLVAVSHDDRSALASADSNICLAHRQSSSSLMFFEKGQMFNFLDSDPSTLINL